MILYLEETINILVQKDLEETNKLVAKGEVKTTETGIKYLKIEENE